MKNIIFNQTLKKIYNVESIIIWSVVKKYYGLIRLYIKTTDFSEKIMGVI